MKKAVMIICLLVISSVTYGKEKQYKIKRTDNGYTFTYFFESMLCKDSALTILFEINHLVKYSSQTPDIKLISRDTNSYVISYSMKYLFFTGESVFRRTLRLNDNMILIEMLHFIHNSSILPKVLKTSAQYRIVQRKKGVKIVYNQECRFDKQINWFYLKILEGRLNEAAAELQQYFRKREG